ncbi:TOX high mobility group box family member 4 [Aix galericulata]|nr:TOX high mobility group box family member 4 [Aix galericulata]
MEKQKKKKDPNEPQKPLSAYALFFRDTQAAIKGQNPNATFGEVSKIVASMWDSLGEEQKQVYKRKTEAAKKEYLKALAAYRAILVESPTPMSLELVAESPAPGPESPRPRCVRSGCDNPPVPSSDWDNEYCSSECVVKHCRDVFLAWLAARNASTSVVFVK